jgi:hypothetical protein
MGQEDNSAMEFLNATLPKEAFGPDLQNDVAESVKRLFPNKRPKETLDAYRTEHMIPSNCKELSVPKVNSEIWSILPPRTKQVDFAHQTHQQQLGLAGVMTAKCVDILFNSGGKMDKAIRDQLLKLSLESLSVIGNASQEISQKRKQDIRPSLSKEASAICGASSTSEWLFGENIAEQLRSAKVTANVMRSSVGRVPLRSSRFTPYRSPFNNGRSFNYKGPPPFRRGGNNWRANRGRSLLNRPDYSNRPAYPPAQ